MMNFITGFWWQLYPSDVGAVLGLASYLVILALIISLVMRRWNLARALGAYLAAYIAVWLTTLDQYFVEGGNPASAGQMVSASGRPFTMFTDDAGMTDMRAHEWAVIANFIIFFVVALLILRLNVKQPFRK